MKSFRMDGWDTPEIVEAEKQMLLAAGRLSSEHLLFESISLMEDAYAGRISPVHVAKILDDAGVNHTLIGAHALAVHTRAPRATKDVDMVVSDVPEAVSAIKTAYPKLKTLSLGKAGVRFLDAMGREVLDLLTATGVGRAHALDNQKYLKTIKGQVIKVGSLALMLALKYIAMHSETRSNAKKQQDLADFTKMIEANDRDDVPAKQAAGIIMKNNMILAAQFLMDVKKIQDGGHLYLDGVDDEEE